MNLAINIRAALLLALLLPAVAPALAADSPVTESSQQLDLSAYRGKVVYLDFWASWCAPCRRSFPWMNEMKAKYQDDGLVIIGVNVDSEPGLADEFLAETPASFRIIRDPDGRLARRFELLGMPNSFLINRDGEVVAKHVGFRSDSPEKYERQLRQLLGMEHE